jgi:N-acetylmuramoyl-L-alanine amidase
MILMIKAIFSSIWLLFIALNSYAYQPYLESFNVLRISPDVESVIFTFNKIDNYRFIMLSNDYWYVTIPKQIMTLKTIPKPQLSIKQILIRQIKGETRIFVRMDPSFKYKYKLLLSENNKYLITRIEKINQNLKTQKNSDTNIKISANHQSPRQTITQTTKHASSQTSETSKPNIIKKPRTIKHTPVIVLDPGHGGKDPGAIGIYNKEKNIVLDIAKKTASYLKRYGYKVVLTRTSDTYPTLADRSRLSNNVKADIFVSIHANYAIKNKRKARGLEVYFLNTTSDKRAINLAARENGVTVKEVGDINKILLSLIQSAKIDKSKLLALTVYNSVLKNGKRSYHGYKGRGVKQAPFYVLVDTRCPSILIETAFVNNPQDAYKLKSRSFRNSLAKGIAEGIAKYIKYHLKNTTKY